MDLLNEVKDYIKNYNEFDESLALKIIEFQSENIPFYGDFLKKTTGKTRFNRLKEVPPFPTDYFKSEKLFAFKTSEGFFESSGTTGERSRVYYNKTSLGLYRTSALTSYPLKNKPLKTFIDIEKYGISSLAYMVKLFTDKFGGGKINDIDELKDGDVLFLTAIQLHRIINEIKEPIILEIDIIETGGYKKLKKDYSRFMLYKEAKKIFKKAHFYTEYGMTELFSQFYADETNPFKDHHYAKVFLNGTGYLKVFDFANLFQVSYLVVPDILRQVNGGFEYIKRDVEDERGCSFTFG